MKLSDFINMAAAHCCVICGVALIVIQILDWYNPFMDFLGHSTFLLTALCVSALWLGIYTAFLKKEKAFERPVKRRRK